MNRYGLKQRTLGHILEDQARAHQDRVFLRCQGEQVTYGELDKLANRVANSLLRLGVRPGDIVGLLMSNCPQFIYAWFGLAKIGAAAVPINTAYKADLLQYVIDKSDMKMLLISSQFLERIAPLAEGLKKVEQLVVHQDETSQGQSPSADFGLPQLDFSGLLESSPAPPGCEVSFKEPMAIIATSGTTGPSKLVMRSHHQFYFIASHCVRAMQATGDDIFYNCLPLCHGTAHTLALLPALLTGGQFALSERFSATNFWNEIRSYGATVFCSAGTLLAMLYRQPPRPNDSDNPVRVCLSVTSLEPDLHLDFERRFGLKVIEVYGLTEASILTSNWYHDDCPGSCGKALPEFEVKIVDDDDQELPPNAVGEIVARPRVPWITTLGYYGDPGGTWEASSNLWLHTGDLARKDEAGRFYFVGRKKDVIRRRGENVSAFEVESVVDSLPQVLESAAVAVPSELGEDDIKIVVVLKEGQRLAPEEVIAFCEHRLPYFAVPRYVEFKQALPKTTNERVKKYLLREEGVTAHTWDREKAGYKLKR